MYILPVSIVLCAIFLICVLFFAIKKFWIFFFVCATLSKLLILFSFFVFHFLLFCFSFYPNLNPLNEYPNQSNYTVSQLWLCATISLSLSHHPLSLSLFNLGPNHYRVVPLDVIKPRAPQYTFRIKLKVFLIDTPGKIYVLLFFFPKNFKHFVCAIKYVYVYTYYKLKKKKQIIHNFKCLNSYVCVCVMYIVIA